MLMKLKDLKWMLIDKSDLLFKNTQLLPEIIFFSDLVRMIVTLYQTIRLI
jgi:hypothetical protein